MNDEHDKGDETDDIFTENFDDASPKIQESIDAVLKSYFWFFEEYVHNVDPEICRRAKDYAISNLAVEGITIENIDRREENPNE